MSNTKRKVAYFYDPDIGGFYYGPGHPMKPHRIRMAHNLILHYGLANMMEVYRPRPASAEDMQIFHSEDYIDFLRNVTPDNKEAYANEMRRFNVGEDCPVFSGQYKYCQLYAGGSVGGAVKLNYGNADVVINWSGGLHHAKKAEASGFCYVNDIVLATLELLKYHARVLYVDIDIHHGDGVEEAFLTTDRVMTVSFHKFGAGFFPGTGDLANSGVGPGRYHAVNVPLKDGMTDDAYEQVFQPVMRRVVEVYQPEVIVFQSGADSLAGDRLGAFNLSMKGHAECQQFMMGFGLPMLVLGGGGYKINNVARCWTYETGRILGVELEDELPENEYREYFAPDYRLHIPLRGDVENLNTREYLDQLKRKLFANIQRIGTANGVPFYERPPDLMKEDDLATTDAAPQPESVARLWDGRSSDADVGSRARIGSAGGSGEREQSGNRSREDRDYSDDPGSTTEREQSEPLGKGGRAAMWQPPGRASASLLQSSPGAAKALNGTMPMDVDRPGPAESDRGPAVGVESF